MQGIAPFQAKLDAAMLLACLDLWNLVKIGVVANQGFEPRTNGL